MVNSSKKNATEEFGMEGFPEGKYPSFEHYNNI
jgi:hypothetical protein